MSLTDVATVLTLFFAAVGLFFAAVAAWGAVETVRLTRLTRDEADVRRLRDALLGLKHACNLIERMPEYGWTPTSKTGSSTRGRSWSAPTPFLQKVRIPTPTR